MSNRDHLYGWTVLGRTKALRIKTHARIWIRKAIPSPGRCYEGRDTGHAGRAEWTTREHGNKWRLTSYSVVYFKETSSHSATQEIVYHLLNLYLHYHVLQSQPSWWRWWWSNCCCCYSHSVIVTGQIAPTYYVASVITNRSVKPIKSAILKYVPAPRKSFVVVIIIIISNNNNKNNNKIKKNNTSPVNWQETTYCLFKNHTV